jgi:hypothetical protein
VAARAETASQTSNPREPDKAAVGPWRNCISASRLSKGMSRKTRTAGSGLKT